MGWFGSSKSDKNEPEVSQKVAEALPSTLSKPVPREKLPEDLQKLIDREDDFMDRLYDGQSVAPLPYIIGQSSHAGLFQIRTSSVLTLPQQDRG